MGEIRVAELFAGVGGFRLGLDETGGFRTIWANQWEPPGNESKQFAWRCYEAHFGKDSCINRDIHEVMDDTEAGTYEIPDVDMVVGGFPCQDYSITKPLSQSHGIFGAKGVLWWEIYRFLQLKEPRYCLFENVDRLLKSPASQRGRDFAIMLSCLMHLGYAVEWRVVNSAAYGFPQRRKRVYIYATRKNEMTRLERLSEGVMMHAFPARLQNMNEPDSTFPLSLEPYEITNSWPGGGTSPFRDAGTAAGGIVVTCDIEEMYDGPAQTLADVLMDAVDVPDEYWIDDSTLPRWQYLKGSKRERRVARNGHEYWYSEGGMSFPDPTDRPSRTILTGEGGRAASRFKHVVEQDGRLRRLVPVELERLQGFPDDWTDTGMRDTQRAFCMGNALVVGVVERIGRAINELEA